MLTFHVPQFHIRPLAGPELRKDPIIDRWVIISTDRLGRPQEFVDTEPAQPLARCPFCAGHEHMTPPPTFAYPSAEGWQVRVVPNTFPAVKDGTRAIASSGLFECQSASGRHEVVVACPQHETRLARLAPDSLAALLRAFRERIATVARERPELYSFVFSNHRAPAGASIEHAHAQIVALPRLPDQVGLEIAAGSRHHWQTGRCPFCDLITQEQRLGTRVVMETDRFIVLAAYAARFPCEVWLLPRRHVSRFEQISDDDLVDLGSCFWRLLDKLDRGLDDPSLNYILHTAPASGPDLDGYHWHIEVLPRLTGAAGFEWGTGMNINPVPPEQAAAYLRSI